MNSPLIEFAAQAIKSYLNESPRGADTVEGIHRWWIRWPGEPERLDITIAALTQLEQSGIVEVVNAGNRMIWRRRSEM